MRGGGGKQILSAVCQQAASIADLALSFFRGATILQIFGSCAVLLILQIERRLCRYALHILVGVTGCFTGAGGGSGVSGIWKGC